MSLYCVHAHLGPIRKENREDAKTTKKLFAPTFSKTVLDDDSLCTLAAADTIECLCVSDLTEELIEQYVDDRYKVVINKKQLHLKDLAVRNENMRMHFSKAEKRIWTLGRDYSNALQTTEYKNIVKEKSHIAISHILKNFKPQKLYLKVIDVMDWQRSRNVQKKHLNVL